MRKGLISPSSSDYLNKEAGINDLRQLFKNANLSGTTSNRQLTVNSSGAVELTPSANVNEIDAVILDLNMPKMSGQMTIEKMLQLEPKTKIIISSGHTDEYYRDGIRDKVNCFVKKPYSLIDMVQTLRKILDS